MFDLALNMPLHRVITKAWGGLKNVYFIKMSQQFLKTITLNLNTAVKFGEDVSYGARYIFITK